MMEILIFLLLSKKTSYWLLRAECDKMTHILQSTKDYIRVVHFYPCIQGNTTHKNLLMKLSLQNIIF